MHHTRKYGSHADPFRAYCRQLLPWDYFRVARNRPELLRMRFFHVGNAVPDDSPRSIALTLELRNEVCLMRHQNTCTTVVFVISATVDCQVSANRNIHSLFDQTDSPKGVVGKTHLEALSVGFDPNS